MKSFFPLSFVALGAKLSGKGEDIHIILKSVTVSLGNGKQSVTNP